MDPARPPAHHGRRAVLLTLSALLAGAGVLAALATDPEAAPARPANTGTRGRGPSGPRSDREISSARAQQPTRPAADERGTPSRAPAVVRAASLPAEDRVLLVQANPVLASTPLGPIPDSARMRVDDLPAFRAIVQGNTAAVDAADREWTSLARALTAPLERDLIARIDAGQRDGLPRTADNRLQRRVPFEAITEVVHGGEAYVVRVSPTEQPRLAALGQVHDDAQARMLAAFDTTMRALFVARGD